jgi:hypothetical protein
MPTRRLSLHLPQVALDALSPGPDDTLAGRITEVALRHRALLTEATPSLTEAPRGALLPGDGGATVHEVMASAGVAGTGGPPTA